MARERSTRNVERRAWVVCLQLTLNSAVSYSGVQGTQAQTYLSKRIYLLLREKWSLLNAPNNAIKHIPSLFTPRLPVLLPVLEEWVAFKRTLQAHKRHNTTTPLLRLLACLCSALTL